MPLPGPPEPQRGQGWAGVLRGPRRAQGGAGQRAALPGARRAWRGHPPFAHLPPGWAFRATTATGPRSVDGRWLGLRPSGYRAFDSTFSQTRKQRSEEQARAPPLAPWPVHGSVRSPGRGAISDPGTKAPGQAWPRATCWARSRCVRACLAVTLGFRGMRGPHSPHLVVLFPIPRCLLCSVPPAFSLRGGCPNTYT